MSRCLRPVRNRLPRLSCLALACITLLACAGETEPTGTPLPPPPPPPDPAIGIEFFPTGLSLLVGSVGQFTARAYDAARRTVPASFSWSSADVTIATVGGSDGLVTAISPGTTTVTVTAGSLRATAPVLVSPPLGNLAATIAFTRGRQSATGDVTFDVLVYSFTEGIPRSLPRPPEFASVAAPAWSPDGTWMAVEVIDSVLSVSAEDGIDYLSNIYVLRADAPAQFPWRALTADGRSRSPAWSPDGSRIAYLGGSRRSEDEHVYIVDVSTGESVRLTPTAGHYSAPRWSPDGTRLVFSNGLVGNGDVFIVNADPTDLALTNVTQHPAFDGEPSWSPDGSQLAFVSDREWDPGHHLEVFVVDLVDVGRLNASQLTANGWSSGPVWSPDGRLIAFAEFGSKPQGIFVVGVVGVGLVRLTSAPVDSWDYAPAWRR